MEDQFIKNKAIRILHFSLILIVAIWIKDTELFSHEETTSLNTSNFPAAITFLVADLKYSNEKKVKICEVQQGSLSAFNGDKFIHNGKSEIAENFHRILNDYSLHTWTILKDIREEEVKRLVREDSEHWTAIESIHELELEEKLDPSSSALIEDPDDISQYRGFLYVKPKSIDSLDQFHSSYPGLIVIDEVTFPYWIDKYMMSLLFEDNPILSKLKPRWKLYPKKYSNKLFKSIISDINSDLYVIKPRGTFRGKGIIIVTKEDLEETLKKISKRTMALKYHPDPSYRYWYYDRFNSFIVEEFIHSDPIAVRHLEGKLYDPTLRITFFLICNNNKINVVFTGAFLKFPKKSVYEVGTLNEKYISYGKSPHYDEPDPEVLADVKRQLNEALPLLFQKMLMENKVSVHQ